MKTPSPPAAPDPAATAAAQGAANRETALAQAELNMINQTDAFGNKLTYNPIGKSEAGNPRYEAVTTLSPEQQALLNKQTALSGQGLDTAQSLFNQTQATLGSAAPTFDENYRQQQLNAMLQRQQPQLDQRRQQIMTELMNAGATPGTPAYNAAMDEYNRALTDMNLALDIQAGNEARSQYGTQLGARSQAINELTGLLGLGQVQSPSFVNTPQTGIAQTDVMGPINMQYQSQLAGWNANNDARNSMIGGLAGLGGSALGGWGMAGFPALALSDVRTKKNIEHIGYTDVTAKVPIYKYDYVWEGDGQAHTGVMAQELAKVKPEAVHDLGGVLAVDYAEVR